ncbi:MAG: polyphosphate kinase 2 family protein [Gammaproteobacteria bacterium]|nr:polyphosphate kinase 2 family protein [Gammaproteobacteria bacterium]
MTKKYRVPFDGSFQLAEADSAPDLPPETDERILKDKLKKEIKKISRLQEVLYAHDKYALLLIFQAMDAAGKDSTIRAVMSGVNPAGCQVSSFKQPSAEELDHDFLWRITKRLPERGRIGIFNRSYYEDVLVVKVHPEYLASAKLPAGVDEQTIWRQRYRSIRDYETHLHRNGTVIVKFWLNVSLDEQKRRFLARLDDPDKYWKFSAGDVDERALWSDYMQAYETALNETSRKHAPWYAIPADNKPYMRYRVAKTIRKTLEKLDVFYPDVSEEAVLQHATIRKLLESDDDIVN